ncbi:MAG: response regulator [Inquilinus sp.]|uniref:response regulator n=1 Tax=Inquilinus sp. TaxID=1932117 RepID=UPI003F37FFAA
MVTGDGLHGRRVLVVEDEALIAFEIEDTLERLGCVVVGPLAALDDAVLAARTEALDAAILDVTIRGGLVFPVAEELLSRKIPFAFASGYGDWALPESMQNMARLTKPFGTEELEAQIRLLCGQD